MVSVTSLSDCTDEELMNRLQRQDVKALDVLYQRHHRLALALAYRIVGERETAEEIVQEAFLSAWRQAASFRVDRGGARGWFFSIVRHRSIDRLRRARNLGSSTGLTDMLVDDRTPDVWQVADMNLRRERIVAALATLPSEQREAIELAYYGGLTHQEISLQTGIPLGTVKGRTRLAMEKLRVALADLAAETGGRA
jgi:RNA polymerase sigma-70 factor (ECF subfamily)